MKFLEYVRNRYHPLHRLRQLYVFREWILPALDKPIAANVPWLKHPWWVKRITHAVYILAPEDCEPNVTKVFIKIIQRLPAGSRFFDIGANIGKYTWYAASLQANMSIHAFEPDINNFQLLERTLKECSHKDITLHYAAISNHNGSAEFTSDAVTGATGTLESGETFTQRHFSCDGTKTTVEVATLDTVASQVGYPNLIKIDVEGHEHAIFEGATDVFRKSRPIVLFECFVHPLPFQNYFDSSDYVLFDADKTGKAHEETTNYWAVPIESPLRESVFGHDVKDS